MTVEVLVLVENTVERPGLLAEHGLSVLVRTPAGQVLFDTGQGRALPTNLGALGIAPRDVDRVVLSHGHFDHTGGLRALLAWTGPREIVTHAEALGPKYMVQDGNVRDIGIPDSPEFLEGLGARFRTIAVPTQVIPGVRASGPVPRERSFEPVGARFQKGAPDALVPDEIADDQALLVDTTEGPVVVLGCAHAGLINTLDHMAKLAGTRRFAAVIGGTHLVDADDERLRRTAEALTAFDIARLAPCHCTGFAGQLALREACGDAFVLARAGDRFVFGDDGT